MKRSTIELYLFSLIFTLPSVFYWYDQRGQTLEDLSLYNFFPLLGLVAFTLMWSHFMVAAVKRLRPEMYDYKRYFRITSNLVLALIILHPALLIYKSATSGTSTFDYAGDQGRIFIIFGLLALSIFLLYELIERLRSTPAIKNNWPFVVAANRIGFILIYAHGLQLGQHLQTGWLRGLWLFFGLTTAIYFIWAFSQEISKEKLSDN